MPLSKSVKEFEFQKELWNLVLRLQLQIGFPQGAGVFTVCGKTLVGTEQVSGQDLSRAVNAAIETRASAPGVA